MKTSLSILEDGFHRGISMDDYHGDTETFSKSSLADFYELGPAKFKFRRGHKKETKQMIIGTAAHMAILEPELYDESIAIVPSDNGKPLSKRTNAYKEWEKEKKGKLILTEYENDLVMGIKTSVLRHNIAGKLFNSGAGAAEITGLCRVGEHTRIKFRPDYIPAPGILVDLKTTELFGTERFYKMFFDKKYHWSAYISTMCARKLTGVGHKYFFVVVDTQKCSAGIDSHQVEVLKCSNRMMSFAGEQVAEVIEQLEHCLKNDKWPSLSTTDVVREVELPKYAKL